MEPELLLAVPGVAFAAHAFRMHRRAASAERRLGRALESSALLAQRLEVVSRLHEAGRALNSAHDLNEVLETILTGAATMLTPASGSIMLLEDDLLRVAAAVGNEHVIGVRVGLGAGIAGEVARSRKPLLVNGTASPSRFPGLVTRASPVHSAISVPMVESDELVGVLNVAAPSSHTFTDDDVAAVAAFAEYAAAAIAKARLYDARGRESDELAYRATHDALTGMPNRSILRDAVERTGDGGVLLFIDLDGFKAVNDRLGHAGGDVLLEAAARRIITAVACNDVAARVGGDEFAVFLSTTTQLPAAISAAERLLERLEEDFVVHGTTVSVSASVGIALRGAHGEAYDELMRAADQALYDAKRAGKSRWQVAPMPPGAAPEAVRPPQQRTTEQVAAVAAADPAGARPR